MQVLGGGAGSDVVGAGCSAALLAAGVDDTGAVVTSSAGAGET
jgi:hypothetical protein